MGGGRRGKNVERGEEMTQNHGMKSLSDTSKTALSHLTEV